jgi:hypothetical protein
MLVSACSALGGENPAATQQAEVTAYIAESTAVGERILASGTQAAATASAAETYIAQVDGVNRQVVATLRAGIPPTPQIVTAPDPSLPVGTILAPDTMGMEPAGASSSGGIAQFLQLTQTASSVRSSDGCAENVTNQFAVTAPEIYATARALNVSAGTEMGVEWSSGGQVVFTSSFVIEQNSPDFCFWFFITPADVPFTPGEWSVRILVNGAPTQPFAFSITG